MPLKPEAAAAWPAVCRAHEGSTTWMYLDTKGLVTTGVGFLIDSPAAAAALPWLTKAGTPASAKQVEVERRAVKLLQEWKRWNGLDARWRNRAELHLTDAAVDARLAELTPRYWSGVVRSAPNVDEAPAPAQLALLDLAWQNGPAFLDGWPDTRAAVRAGDWRKVAGLLWSFLPQAAGRTVWRVKQFTEAAAAATPAPAPAPNPTPEVPPVADVKWFSKYGAKYRRWRGGNMTQTGIAVCKAIPTTVTIMQGGLSTSVSKSANTHARLGAYDVKSSHLSRGKTLELCSELIRSGECAFPRGGLFGSAFFAPHVHVASNNDYKSLHPEAQAQVRDFKHNPRRNGLSGHGRYVGPHTSLGNWSGSPYNAKNIKKPAAKQYRVVVGELIGTNIDRHPSKARKRGFVINADRLVRRWGRWNVVTTAGTFYAVADSKQKYLDPIVPPPAAPNPARSTR